MVAIADSCATAEAKQPDLTEYIRFPAPDPQDARRSAAEPAPPGRRPPLVRRPQKLCIGSDDAGGRASPQTCARLSQAIQPSRRGSFGALRNPRSPAAAATRLRRAHAGCSAGSPPPAGWGPKGCGEVWPRLDLLPAQGAHQQCVAAFRTVRVCQDTDDGGTGRCWAGMRAFLGHAAGLRQKRQGPF